MGEPRGSTASVTSLLEWTLSFLRPYRHRVGLILVLLLAEVGLSALQPWPLKIVIDFVLEGHPIPEPFAGWLRALHGGDTFVMLVLFATAGVVLQIANYVASTYSTQLQVDTGQRVVYTVRYRLFDHLQALGLHHHVTTSTGDAVYRIDVDAYAVENLLIGGFPLLTSAATLVVMFAILVKMDVTVALLSLTVVIAYLGAVYGPLSTIAHSTGQLQSALAGAKRLRAAFALEPEPLEPAEAADARQIAGRVAFKDVGFAYPDGTSVLHDITFTATPGEMVALVGLTGAGKTTLVSLIPRFYDPTTGSVLIDGIDARRFRVRELRERIAIVLQDPVLFSGTIADNVRYGRLDASDDEIEQAARAAHAHEFVSRLPKGYHTQIAEAGGGLSGGERQRLSVARAILKGAPILILDEPTSSLDAISEEIVFDALRRLRAGRTTIVIAHRLSTVRDADRILVLDGGRIVAQGRHDELLTSSQLYRRMCARLSVGKSLDEPETVDELIEAAK